MILIANGWEVAYTYDNLDRVTEVKASKDGTSYTIGRYIYDKLGRVARFVDGQVSGKSCTYGYDLTDRLCEAVFDDGTAYRYTYDANDCLVKEVQTTPDGVRTVTRGYDADSRETSVACGSARIEKTFDKLGRLSSIRRNGGKHTTTYIYETAADGGQTGRIKTVKNGGGIGMVIGVASSAITQYMFNGEINWKSVGVAAVGGFVSGAVAASPLGLTGQIGVGAAVGAVSYVADCKVNGSALKVDELAVSAAAGAVSGWIGGSGVNQYKALSNTIKTASKTTARFTRLISTKGSASLAAKRIAEAKMWRDTVLKGTTWISSIKFAAGTGTSNVIAQLWTKAKNKVRSWFK